jgi:hypothetical protein
MPKGWYGLGSENQRAKRTALRIHTPVWINLIPILTIIGFSYLRGRASSFGKALGVKEIY